MADRFDNEQLLEKRVMGASPLGNNVTEGANTAVPFPGYTYSGDSITIESVTEPTDLLSSVGGFEVWSLGVNSAPDGWSLGAGTTAQESSIVKAGSYSAKIIRTGTNAYYQKNLTFSTALIGRSFTLSCWVYCSLPNVARISIFDGTQPAISSVYHNGDSIWRLLTVTGMVSAGAVQLSSLLVVRNSDTFAYFDEAKFEESYDIFTSTNHGLVTGDVIKFTSLPSYPIYEDKTYMVIVLTSDTFYVTEV